MIYTLLLSILTADAGTLCSAKMMQSHLVHFFFICSRWYFLLSVDKFRPFSKVYVTFLSNRGAVATPYVISLPYFDIVNVKHIKWC